MQNIVYGFQHLKFWLGRVHLCRGYFSTENPISVHYWPSLRQAVQNIISRLINCSPPRKSAYRALAAFCRSGATAEADAPIKLSILNPTFKREGFIGAAGFCCSTTAPENPGAR